MKQSDKHRSKTDTNLLDLIFLHEGQELEDEARQAEEEIDELVYDERTPGGDLELGVVVQHVVPGVFQRGLEGVSWEHGIHVLHRQVGRAQDVGRAVHRHGGWNKVWEEDWKTWADR